MDQKAPHQEVEVNYNSPKTEYNWRPLRKEEFFVCQAHPKTHPIEKVEWRLKEGISEQIEPNKKAPTKCTECLHQLRMENQRAAYADNY